MIDNIFNLLFRCAHRRLTRPFLDTAAHSYTVCLDCSTQYRVRYIDHATGQAPGPTTRSRYRGQQGDAVRFALSGPNFQP